MKITSKEQSEAVRIIRSLLSPMPDDPAEEKPAPRAPRRLGLGAAAHGELAFQAPVSPLDGGMPPAAELDDADDRTRDEEDDADDKRPQYRPPITRQFGLGAIGSDHSITVIVAALRDLKRCHRMLERNLPRLRAEIIEPITSREAALHVARAYNRQFFIDLPLSSTQLIGFVEEYRKQLQMHGASTTEDLDNLT